MYGSLCIALTISPPKRLGDQSFHYRDDVEKILCIKRCSKRYIIYPEFDDLGRLHYHGTVYIHDKVKWFKACLPKLERMGYVKIKLNPTLAWTIYQSKSWGCTRDILSIASPLMPQSRAKQPGVLQGRKYLPIDTKQASILDWFPITLHN